MKSVKKIDELASLSKNEIQHPVPTNEININL